MDSLPRITLSPSLSSCSHSSRFLHNLLLLPFFRHPSACSHKVVQHNPVLCVYLERRAVRLAEASAIAVGESGRHFVPLLWGIHAHSELCALFSNRADGTVIMEDLTGALEYNKPFLVLGPLATM